MFLSLRICSTSVTQNWFHKRYSKFLPQVLLKIDPQTLLMIGSTNVIHISVHMYVYMHVCMYVMYALYVCICVALQIGSTSVTQNWFHNCYSKQIHEISFTNVTQKRSTSATSTNVTQNWFHKCYSKQIHERYSKLVPQILLKIGPQAVLNLKTYLIETFLSPKVLKTTQLKL